jgi:hypothetical protein
MQRCKQAGETLPLCRPRAANFPTWDAAAIDDRGCLTLYQATVSDVHDINVKGLHLAEGLGRLSSGAIRFVFVVPSRGGPSKVMRLSGDSGVLPPWLAVRGMTQYVLEIAMVPSAFV